MRALLLFLFLFLLPCPLAALAQVPALAVDTGVEACASIEIDAARLACYDAAMRRTRPDPESADAAAAEAAASLAEPPSLFRRDAPAAASMQAAAAIANAGQGSLLDSRWELARGSKLGIFNFRAYKPVYLFPLFATSDVNERPFSPSLGAGTGDGPIDALETKFQISFKTKAIEGVFGDTGDLWMAYTQSSRWQVFNGEASRPFRETNYEPEVLLAFRTGYGLLGWKGRLAGIGINHQSNGRGNPLSRSWNRIIFDIGLDRDGWALTLRPWLRLPEDRAQDDNPDIDDYMGRGDATLVRVLPNGQQLSLMLRHSLRGGDHAHGAAQFDWAFPLHRTFRGHLQVFDGYGESLVDYNHRATYIGLGISLMEWY
jgi:phospholipase A1